MPDAEVNIVNNRINVESVKYAGRAAQVAGHTKFRAKPGFSVPASPYNAERVAWAFRGLDVKFDQAFLDLWLTWKSFDDANERRGEALVYREETKAWPHQATCTAYGLRVPYAMFDCAVGTGKSKVVIDIIENREDIRRVLIVGTKKSSSVWPGQFEQHSWSEFEPVMLTPPMTMDERAERLAEELAKPRRTPLIIVTNYSGLQPDFGTNKRENKFATLIMNTEWDATFADESQNIKGWTSEISLQFDKLRRVSKYRYCLSGTPMPSGPLDVPGQLRFLDPGIFPTLAGVKDSYVQYGGYMNMQVLGYKNMAEFSEKLGRVTVHVPASVLNLPEPIRTFVPVTLSKRARKVYDTIERDYAMDYGDGTATMTNNSLTKRLRLQQITSGLLVAEELDTGTRVETEIDEEKYETLLDLIDSLPPDEPLVVFGNFHHDLNMVKKAAERSKRTYMELSGRSDDLEAWKTATSGEILAVQIRSGGVGIDLTRAHIAVYVSINESWGDYTQSEGRLNRPGQKYTCVLYYLIAKNTVDVAVHAIVRNKKDMNAAIREYIKAKYEKV